MTNIIATSNLKFVILSTVSNTQNNDTRLGINYYICITSTPIIFHCNCITTHLP